MDPELIRRRRQLQTAATASALEMELQAYGARTFPSIILTPDNNYSHRFPIKADSVSSCERLDGPANCSMSQTQTHTQPLDGQDHDEVHKKVKSRRPASELRPYPSARSRNGLGVIGPNRSFCDLQILPFGSKD